MVNQDGRTLDLPYAVTSDNPNIGSISLREYESYLLHDRTDSDSLILKAGRLTQQYCVDQWAKCEQSRLRYIEKNQLLYRLETLQGLTDDLRNESSDVHRVAVNEEVAQRSSTGRAKHSRQRGVATAEPEASNFSSQARTCTGGPRYMYQRFLDAMAIVRETGAPNLFITMTCNPNWPEIKESLSRGIDLISACVYAKTESAQPGPRRRRTGVVAAKIHVVEYQKRGLPHAHILLILRPENKPVSAEDVDRLVSAELPDKEKHPKLYKTVISNMLHGPCGQQNPKCRGMKN
ncbi:LOW QUALITY PROTEIN: Helitron helicase [Phytophthora megakarya]|uniref:Helitron helicase n=1 Tax=Phytophthora megakarya TaxID=4795 RepID=A0A225V9M2_9STRA|nr:LOW QUALITY PROTEIN: Helitron helicase [Phytophthora megakarya]